MADPNPFKNAELSPEEWKEKLRDQKFLPTRAEIIKACTDPYTRRYSDNEFIELVDFKGPYQHQYEILTQEFVGALGTYLAERISSIKKEDGSPVVLLEVGAGKGRLSYFLEQELNKKLESKFKIIATDSGESKIENIFPVETLDVQQALAAYKPDIVFASFIPSHGTHDWTEDFEKTDSVQEYIVIGPHQPEGHGFGIRKLTNIEATQLCLHDRELDREYPSESKTMSHRRDEAPKIKITKKE